MKVELACLADSKAFQLSLQFVTTPAGVELRGQVPDEATRQHVLRLARQASYTVVHDRLTLIERCADPTLRETARVTLARYMVDRDARVLVQVLDKGVITLAGQVETLEDKLIASRCLRAVAGCQRVVNNLEVKYPPTPTQDSVKAATAMAEGKTTSAVVTVKADTPVETEKKEPEKADPEKKEPKKKEPEKKEPEKTTMNPRVYPAEAEGLILPVAPNPVLPAPPVGQVSRIQIRHQPLEPHARPLIQSAVQGYSTTQPLKPCGMPGYPGCDPATGQGAVQLTVARVSPPPTILGQLRSLLHGPRPERFDPEPVVAVPAVPEYRVMGNAGLPPVLNPVTTSRKVTPTPTPMPTAPTTPNHTVITVPASSPTNWPAAHGTGLVETPPVPSSPPPQVVPAQAPAPVHTAQKVGVPPSSPLPVTAAPTAQPSAPATRVLTSEQMRRIILQGCGKRCRDVKVTTRPDGQAVFNVYAPVRAEQEVTNALLSIPEVAASNAHIQIHLEP
jgi:hypothetical protein